MPADRYMPIRHAAASWRSWHLTSWWVTRRGRPLDAALKSFDDATALQVSQAIGQPLD